jgi:hypothetical protein
MRTTVTIDDEIFQAVKELARQKNISAGKVLSDLARKGLQAKSTTKSKRGIPVFPVSDHSKIITLDDAKKLDDLPS